MMVETTEIQFGEFVAESRGNGKYYLRHPNGGGAMATLVEVALIKELIEGHCRCEQAAIPENIRNIISRTDGCGKTDSDHNRRAWLTGAATKER